MRSPVITLGVNVAKWRLENVSQWSTSRLHLRPDPASPGPPERRNRRRNSANCWNIKRRLNIILPSARVFPLQF
jgi:hypothetical protein